MMAELGLIRGGLPISTEVIFVQGSDNRQKFPGSRDIVALLRVYSKQKDLLKGIKLHADILKYGLLENNCFVANTLVSMYANCGALAKAQEVIDKLPVRDVVTWSALIAGYAQQGQGEEALNCFEQMQCEGLCPNAVTFTCILKACGSIGAADKGEQIFTRIVREGLLGRNIVLGNALVDMYAKCGALAKAQQVLDEIPVRNVVSWSALIAGYAQHGQGEEALDCFERMQHEGLSPDAVTFTCILKVCGGIRAAEKGEKIHAEIVKQGLLGKSIALGNALVDMYAKCGALTKARGVHGELPVRNVISWGALIAGYTQQGQGEEALLCFEQMQHEGLFPNEVTFTCILKACGSIGAADRGKQLHDDIIRKGLLENNIALGTSLVDMYVKCGALRKAQQVLDELPVRDVVSWNALIAGYTQKGQGEEALIFFQQMQQEGLSPNAVTFACILRAYTFIGAADKGEEIHDAIVKEGLLGRNIVLGNTLVDMYSKCGALAKAQRVLDRLPVRSVVAWSSLMAGYSKQGQGEEALNCLQWMQCEGFSPDAVIFGCILKACGSIGEVDKGKQIHDEIVRQGLLRKSTELGTAVVNMYAKCGALAKAQRVLDGLHIRDVVTWNALIAGYAQQGQGEEAMNCFDRMQCEGLSPDFVTFICILKACGSVGAADKGEKLHDEIVRQGLLAKNIVLGIALVDMYAKCGLLAKAARLFDELPIRDVVSWSALIAGYAQQGQSREVLNCLERMQLEGLSPNTVTFASVLNACSHSGLLDEGQMYFADMSAKYGLRPDVEHHTSMVDLFCRAGAFHKAISVIKKMPSSDDHPVWSALLGACQKWGNVKLARLAFEHALQVNKNDSSAYVSMSNVYAVLGMQEGMQTRLKP